MSSLGSYWLNKAKTSPTTTELTSTLLRDSPQSFHFVGIKGSGMWPLACSVKHFYSQLSRSISIQGSDLKATTEDLERKDITIWNHHSKDHLCRSISGLIYTTAADHNHCERLEARKHDIPCWHRAEMLQALAANHSKSICITGSHGKTSTTATLCHLLHHADISPSGVVGGGLKNYHNHYHLEGKRDLFIYEGDESDGTHSLYTPTIGIITNIAADHLEYHDHSLANLLACTSFFAQNTQEILILPTGVPTLASIADKHKNCITVGFDNKANYRISHVQSSQQGCTFQVNHIPFVSTNIGEHQALNSTFAIAAAMEMGIPKAILQEGLTTFCGVTRRLEKVYEDTEHIIINDYAHNPQKVATAILAVRSAYKDAYIEVIFEPHKLYRALKHKEAFACALSKHIQHIILAPLYSPKGLKEDIYLYHPTSYAKDLQFLSAVPVSVLQNYQHLRQLIHGNAKKGYNKHVTLILGAGESSCAIPYAVDWARNHAKA